MRAVSPLVGLKWKWKIGFALPRLVMIVQSEKLILRHESAASISQDLCCLWGKTAHGP